MNPSIQSYVSTIQENQTFDINTSISGPFNQGNLVMHENNLNIPNHSLQDLDKNNSNNLNQNKQPKDFQSSENHCLKSTSTQNTTLSQEKIILNNTQQDLDANSLLEIQEEKLFIYDLKQENEKLYLNEIYQNLLEEEKNLNVRPNPHYMDYQPDINSKMRAILFEWLDEVHSRFKLRDDTLFCCQWIIDSYLTSRTLLRDRLQLLGITALLIACKEHEIYYPKLKEFIMITDNAYTKKELLDMEIEVLQELNFEILAPSSLEFYNIITNAFNFNRVQYFLGRYFMECALLNDQFLKFPQSVLACSCTYIVMKYFKMKNYNLLYENGILLVSNPQKEIKDAAKEICLFVRNLNLPDSEFTFINKKYSDEKFCKVALLIKGESQMDSESNLSNHYDSY